METERHKVFNKGSGSQIRAGIEPSIASVMIHLYACPNYVPNAIFVDAGPVMILVGMVRSIMREGC